jgi:hypothetical protein
VLARHVETPEELVAERADPAATDGAGAELHVQEPWEGYARLTAAEVIDRLAVADPPTLAVAELYESTHKRRRTVLAALHRQLARQQGGATANRPRQE